MEPTTVRLNESLRERLDEYVEAANEHDNLAQAIRHAVRELVDDE